MTEEALRDVSHRLVLPVFLKKGGGKGGETRSTYMKDITSMFIHIIRRRSAISKMTKHLRRSAIQAFCRLINREAPKRWDIE